MPKCCKCGCDIDSERASALEFVLSKPESLWDCLDCAKGNDRQVKAVFQGVSGVSPMIIVDSVGADKTLYHDSEEKELTDFSYNMTEE